MAERPLIRKEAITPDTVRKCAKYYQGVVEAVYKETRPKLDQAGIVETDKWRYALSWEKAANDGVLAMNGISKDELKRLVQWKICHGKNRPFLPGMIEKNTPKDVQKHSAAAAKILHPVRRATPEAEQIEGIYTALNEICNLHGVGPATGTLVLSVFKPHLVPFFQDETFHWLAGNHSSKLKYDLKEYKLLLRNVLDLGLRLGLQAIHLEQTAYVLSHADKLDERQIKKLKKTEIGPDQIPAPIVDSIALTEALTAVQQGKGKQKPDTESRSSKNKAPKPESEMSSATKKRKRAATNIEEFSPKKAKGDDNSTRETRTRNTAKVEIAAFDTKEGQSEKAKPARPPKREKPEKSTTTSKDPGIGADIPSRHSLRRKSEPDAEPSTGS